jgi:hypothetical protein
MPSPKQFADLLRRYVGSALNNERSQRATVTSIANWNETAEVAATVADGHTIYIHAAVMYDVAVGDVLYVRKLNVGAARARYEIIGYHESAGGSRIPTIRRALDPETILTDDSGNRLMDDSSNLLHDN